MKRRIKAVTSGSNVILVRRNGWRVCARSATHLLTGMEILAASAASAANAATATMRAMIANVSECA